MRNITLLLLFLASYCGYAQPSTAAPTPPARDAADVVSVFSGAYSDIAVSEFSTGWDNADVFDDTAGGDAVKRYVLSGGAFIGIQLAALTNLSGMENFHIDVWVDVLDPGDVLLPKLANFANGTGSPVTNEIEYTYAFSDTADGTWISIDVALSSFNVVSGGSSAIDQVFQIVFGSSGTLAGATMYVDNLYFWRNPVDPNADATLSDLLVDGTTVDGFSPGTYSYDVELPNGTTVVPTVTATATQAGNGSSSVVVTPAAGIPGTTSVLVTAPNGTDTETYLVNFTEAAALPSTPAPTPPGRPAADVISISSGAYTNESITGFVAFGSAVVSDVDIAGDSTIQYEFTTDGSGFQYEYGPGGAGGLDLSTFTDAHIDLYIDAPVPQDGTYDGEVITLQLLNWNGGGFDAVFTQVPITTTGTGNWYSADIDLTTFVNYSLGVNQVQLVQVINQGGVFSPVFIDNIYFHKGTLSNDEFEASSFKVFPNPSSDNWTIQANQNITSVKLFNVLGQQVKSMNMETTQTVIDGSELQSGLYFAKIEGVNGSKTVRLIKE